jgi:hypothetical protein
MLRLQSRKPFGDGLFPKPFKEPPDALASNIQSPSGYMLMFAHPHQIAFQQRLVHRHGNHGIEESPLMQKPNESIDRVTDPPEVVILRPPVAAPARIGFKKILNILAR